MKYRSPLLLSFAVFSCFFSSCELENQTVIPEINSETSVNFSKYIAVGGSTVAGYSNGGLYRDGQMTSYPKLIAQQIGASFEQALFPIGQGNGSGYLVTELNNQSAVFKKVVNKTAIINSSPLTFSKYAGNLGNYGIVGLRVSDVAKTGLGNSKNQTFNPYFDRILAAGKEDISYLELISSTNPSFFTVSIGENDLLDFATSGGKKGLTEISSFSNSLQKLLDALVANKAKGTITNLPNVLDFPYFNFYSLSEILSQNNVEKLYITTSNGIIRSANSQEKILLDAIPTIGKANGLGLKKGFSEQYPLAPEDVLDTDEINALASKVADYNAIIKLEASKRNIALIDLDGVYSKIKDKNLTVNGFTLSNSIFSGGFFSLDGVNPTPRGKAVIANEVIKTINETYKNLLKTPIPTLDISKFEALKIQ